MVEFLDTEEEAEPHRSGGRRVWVLGIVALVGVVGAVVALDHGASPSRRTDLGTEHPEPVVTTAPPRFASDVLVVGNGSQSQSGPGQIVLATDLRNASTTDDLRIAYPITVQLPQGTPASAVTVGIYSANDTDSLVSITAGRTVTLQVSIKIDCAHPAELAGLAKDGVHASVRIAQATGAATFALTPIESYRDMLNETCPSAHHS